MPSKWIKEVADEGKLDLQQLLDIKDILLRIERLLKLARLSTDDAKLHDEISKELKED